MNTWKVILATLVIFGAGLVSGSLLPRRYSAAAAWQRSDVRLRADNGTNATNHIYMPPPSQIPGMRKDFVKLLDAQLHLTPEQTERINQIVAEGQGQTKELWDQIEPEIHDVWMGTKDRIRLELTEDQKVQYRDCMRAPHKKSTATNAPAASQ